MGATERGMQTLGCLCVFLLPCSLGYLRSYFFSFLFGEPQAPSLVLSFPTYFYLLLVTSLNMFCLYTCTKFLASHLELRAHPAAYRMLHTEHIGASGFLHCVCWGCHSKVPQVAGGNQNCSPTAHEGRSATSIRWQACFP